MTRSIPRAWRLAVLILSVQAQHVLAQSAAQAGLDASFEARRAAAIAVGMAAAAAAYAPFAPQVNAAVASGDPAQVFAITMVAYPVAAIAGSLATCEALAANPAACAMIIRPFPGVSK